MNISSAFGRELTEQLDLLKAAGFDGFFTLWNKEVKKFKVPERHDLSKPLRIKNNDHQVKDIVAKYQGKKRGLQPADSHQRQGVFECSIVLRPAERLKTHRVSRGRNKTHLYGCHCKNQALQDQLLRGVAYHRRTYWQTQRLED